MSIMRPVKIKFFLSVFVVFSMMVVFTPLAHAETGSDNVETIIKDGKFFGEVVYRYEHVDQDNARRNANAHTTRFNLGFKTGKYKGFQALAEGQIVKQFNDNFDDLVDGRNSFSVVADPDVQEINQLWLSYDGVPDSVVRIGRQKINLDNQRFIGTVDWRQNDQTYDALWLTNESIENLELAYGYVNNVNRILGDDAAAGDLDSDSHIFHASYYFADWLKVTGYGYLLDFDIAPALSTQTYGVRVTGDAPINGDWSFFYEAELATQSDYADNTDNYDEEYYLIAPGIKGFGASLQFGYEVLGGDGTDSFITPLATLHKFNGWADVFLNTPNQGLEDMYIKATYKLNNVHDFVDGTKLIGVYHEFEGDESGDFGSEWNFAATKTFKIPSETNLPFKSVSPLIKYANYEADDTPFVDEQVFWFQVKLKF